MYRIELRMPVLLLIVLAAWPLLAVGALTLCAAARRTDRELAHADLAPVIALEAAVHAAPHPSAA
jgi:hypothetical protein